MIITVMVTVIGTPLHTAHGLTPSQALALYTSPLHYILHLALPRPSDNQVVIMAWPRGGGRSLGWFPRESSAPSLEWIGGAGDPVETEPGGRKETNGRETNGTTDE